MNTPSTIHVLKKQNAHSSFLGIGPPTVGLGTACSGAWSDVDRAPPTAITSITYGVERPVSSPSGPAGCCGGRISRSCGRRGLALHHRTQALQRLLHAGTQ